MLELNISCPNVKKGSAALNFNQFLATHHATATPVNCQSINPDPIRIQQTDKPPY